MYYISNVTLSILLQLHRARELCFQVYDVKYFEQLKEYAYRIEYMLKNKPEGLSDEEDEEFEDNYKPCITYTTVFRGFNFRLTCEDTERLEIYLKNYITAYTNDDLKEFGNKNEYVRMVVLNEELLKEAKSSKHSLRQYILTGFRYIPVIVDNYLKNNVFIRNMNINLASDEEGEYPLTIFIHADSEDLDSINPDWEEFFDCKFVLDMDWYLNEYKTAARRRDFAPEQDKIYRFLRKSAREKVFITSKVELKRFLTESAIDKNLSIFRSQYREIFNKPMGFDILAYDRTEECYKIHKDILTDKSN